MASGGMFGSAPLGGQILKTDPRFALAQQLMAQGPQGQPIKHWMQGVGQLSSVLAGQNLMRQAQAEAEAAKLDRAKTMQQSFNLGRGSPAGVDPNTGIAWDTARAPDQAAMISNLVGNPNTSDIGQMLQMADIARQQKMSEPGYGMQAIPGIGLVDMRQGTPNVILGEAKPGVNAPFSDDVFAQKRQLNEALAGSRLVSQGWTPTSSGGVRPTEGGPNDPEYLAKRTAAETEARAKAKAAEAAGKPIPSSALKMQNESLEKIGIATGINADLTEAIAQIDAGKLRLGPVENVFNAGRNYLGKSDQNSQAYSSFISTLRKMQNDSIRLNTGVQTEGDAKRAWEEMFQNLNDTENVKKQLMRIHQINQRAVDLHKLQIDTTRQNFGAEPFDFSKFEAVNKPSIGRGTGNKGAPSGVDPAVWEHMTPEEKALFP
jgi:hypothetical protein